MHLTSKFYDREHDDIIMISGTAARYIHLNFKNHKMQYFSNHCPHLPQSTVILRVPHTSPVFLLLTATSR